MLQITRKDIHGMMYMGNVIAWKNYIHGIMYIGKKSGMLRLGTITLGDRKMK